MHGFGLVLCVSIRFSSERSPDLAAHAAERHDITGTDAQRGINASPSTPTDQDVFLDQKESQEWKMASPLNACETRQPFGSDVQRVRVFENVVEKQNVLMMEDGKFAQKPKVLLNRRSFNRGKSEEEGTLVTATYIDAVSPPSPLRVAHTFDTLKMEENRAVSENVPSAEWEDKAMTLRSRRTDGKTQEQPRILRVGALQKWPAGGLEQVEQLKMLQPEEQPKAKATYFALTGKKQGDIVISCRRTRFFDAS
ncbi:hypothetical protein fugu_004214 [Takifugu bimaculatus]|uniref:Uncharacterized protein n=1 Tax=Takifugu bimaculatus TaxID=433685 RepID=A0A4Z2BFP3_9TELE|nr:hypothetical protein fugu_004214 [Takifugu bimaculatus]